MRAFWASVIAAQVVAPAVPAQTYSAKGLIEVKAGSKWGIVDQHGAIIVPLAYDDVFINDDGLIRAEQGSQTTFFDAHGSPRFSGLSSVGEIDRNGNRTFTSNRLTGLMDDRGRKLLPAVFAYLSPFDELGHYVAHYHGSATVIDTQGNVVLGKSFFYLSKLAKNGLAMAKADRTDRSHGFINAKGDWVIGPGHFDDLWEFGDDGLAPAKLNGKWGFINASGQWVVRPISESLLWPNPFSGSGLSAINAGGLWGLVNRTGKFVVPPTFGEIGRESGGTYTVKLNGKEGLIDVHGAYLIRPDTFDNMTAFHSEGLAAAWIGKHSIIIDRHGKSVFGNRFEAIGGFFDGGWAAAKMGGKWGAIDTRGSWLIKPIYECVSVCFDGPPATPPPIIMGGIQD